MKNIKYALLSLMALVMASACYKDNSDFVDDQLRITLSSSVWTFNADGTSEEGGPSIQAVVNVNKGSSRCTDAWTSEIVSESPWASLEQVKIPYSFIEAISHKTYSYDESGIELSVQPNTEYRRKVVVKISCNGLDSLYTFTQLGEKPDAVVTTDIKKLQFAANGETLEVPYTSNMGDVVSFSAEYDESSSDWLSFEKSAAGVKVTAAKWEDKTKGRSATMYITVGTPQTSEATVAIEIRQLSNDDLFYLWGGPTKFALAQAMEMEQVSAGICRGEAYIYPSKGNVICLNKNTRAEVYPVYYLANDGTIKASDSKVTSSDLQLDLVGKYRFTADFNTMTWEWIGVSEVESCLPSSMVSGYPVKAYPAKNGGTKTWMTTCLHWNGGAYAPAGGLKLGCPMVNAGATKTGGMSTQPIVRDVAQTWDATESGGTIVGLDTESDTYGRLYTWTEATTGVCQGGCSTSYDLTAWPLKYCEGKTFVDAVGKEYKMNLGATGFTSFSADDAAVESGMPTVKMQIQGICPFGWHIGNLQDYRDLLYAANKACGSSAEALYSKMTGNADFAATLRGSKGWLETLTPTRNAAADDFAWNLYPCGRRLYKDGWSQNSYGNYYEAWICHPGANKNSNKDHITGEQVYQVWRIKVSATGNTTFNGTYDTGNACAPIRCVKNYEVE